MTFIAFAIVVLFLAALVREALNPLPPSARYLRQCRRACGVSVGVAARIAGVQVQRVRELEGGAEPTDRHECFRIGHDLRRWAERTERRAA